MHSILVPIDFQIPNFVEDENDDGFELIGSLDGLELKAEGKKVLSVDVPGTCVGCDKRAQRDEPHFRKVPLKRHMVDDRTQIGKDPQPTTPDQELGVDLVIPREVVDTLDSKHQIEDHGKPH